MKTHPKNNLLDKYIYLNCEKIVVKTIIIAYNINTNGVEVTNLGTKIVHFQFS